VGRLAIEADQVGPSGPAFHQPMLARPDPLVVLHMPIERTQDESLHNLPWHRGKADSPVVPRILLSALLVDGCYIGDPMV